MKQYHECAVVKDGNKRVGYMIAEAPVNGIINAPWKLIDSGTFENLVANNKVQYLILENNTIKCRYSPEELQDLKKRKFSQDYIRRTMQDYWNMDVSFKLRHVRLAENGMAIACSVASITKMFGVCMIPIYMFGHVRIMQEMVYRLESEVNSPLDKCFKHNGLNAGTLMLPSIMFEKLISNLGKDYCMLFDTSTVKFMSKNSINTPKLPIIQGRVTSDKLTTIINRVDSITSETEKRLGI